MLKFIEGPGKRGYYSVAVILAVIMLYLFYHTMDDVLTKADEYILHPAKWMERPWTVVTNLFVHLNWSHLLLNAFLLLQFGPTLEKRIGTKRFLTVFFVCGVLGSYFDVLYLKDGITLGASGAVLGVMTCLTAIDRDNIINLGFASFKINIMTVILFFFIIDTFMLGSAGINNLAHLIGIVSGFILGYMIIEGEL